MCTNVSVECPSVVYAFLTNLRSELDCGPDIQEGFLLGSLTHYTRTQITDADMGAQTSHTKRHISSYLPMDGLGEMYNASGAVRDYTLARVKEFAHANHLSVVGWYRWLSEKDPWERKVIMERRIHKQLQQKLDADQGFLLLLFNTGHWVRLPLQLINLGNTLSSAYKQHLETDNHEHYTSLVLAAVLQQPQPVKHQKLAVEAAKKQHASLLNVLQKHLSPLSEAQVQRSKKVQQLQMLRSICYQHGINPDDFCRAVLLPEKSNEETEAAIKNIFKSRIAKNKEFLWEVDHDLAKKLFEDFGVPERHTTLCQTSNYIKRLPQDSETLLIYPPPPQKSGICITMLDYKSLQEESFLNDTILNFYLKLPEKQRNKVHLFSTLFYKRLTTKYHHPAEDDPRLSAAAKRHARVKSWTKCVDIFDKDFIIIPVNEQAHWFLAIICFPGLREPVHFESGAPIAPEALAAEQAACVKNGAGRRKVRHQQIPIIDDGECSHRDEAEGDEDELEEDEDEDDDANSLQPSREKSKTTEQQIPGLGGDEEQQQTPPAKKKSACTLPPIKQPCILILDSLPCAPDREHTVAMLRDYLRMEYICKRKRNDRTFTRETLKGAVPCVPKQTNFIDCGLYTLQFTESFFRQPLKDYRFPISSIVNWFDEAIVAGKRKAIARLIKTLMDEYNPNNNFILPPISFSTPGERPKKLAKFAESLH
ncbi:hypothetical protein HAZT_HAZT011751 [Hyalella azteca]|uniref:Ubiquitin-like protease family profile domain-containing protein n=1 Tax=Hyalella azteca TaxID=294128 RepID=A0A6A0GTS9_HYAAZ|nr:hypothetical protein HAZT_HAZT011751 [Hyalella azteca]